MFIVALSDEQRNNVCKFGQGADCCIYLVLGETFECVKKHPDLSATMEARLKAGTTVSKATGGKPGCVWNAL